MKIEKISENQIRCTLNKDDLMDRQLRLSELAYGTEKAKLLFRDMMQQAAFEFGFEADDIPLMIEAIPISPECLVLVVTKVEDPDELDTRFSKFSPEDSDDAEDNDLDDDTSYADEIINCFSQLDNLLEDSKSASDEIENENDTSEYSSLPESLALIDEKDSVDKEIETKESKEKQDLIKVFSFQTLDEVIKLSAGIVFSYHGQNILYKDPVTSTYYLVLYKSDHTPQEFNKICNVVSEYAKLERNTYATVAYYKEHFETIVKDNAIQILSIMQNHYGYYPLNFMRSLKETAVSQNGDRCLFAFPNYLDSK